MFRLDAGQIEVVDDALADVLKRKRPSENAFSVEFYGGRTSVGFRFALPTYHLFCTSELRHEREQNRYLQSKLANT